MINFKINLKFKDIVKIEYILFESIYLVSKYYKQNNLVLEFRLTLFQISGERLANYLSWNYYLVMADFIC